jgi:hypothetical protein
MTTNAEKNKLIENLKGNKVLDFQEYADSKYLEREAFKKQFKRDWNANHEKIEKQMEEKEKALKALKEEWLETAFPERKTVALNAYKFNIQIVIIEENQE